MASIAAFLGSMASMQLIPWDLPYSALLYNARTDLPARASYAFGGTMSNRFLTYSLLRPDDFNGFASTEILIRCASTTPFGLALAPD